MESNENTDQPEPVDYLGIRTKRLQTIVSILDTGGKPMDELITLYEEGINLVKECKAYLSQMEGKIIDITKSLEDE